MWVLLITPAPKAALANGFPHCLEVLLLHPRKRRNTERGPEAGVLGASPGVWVRRTGGGMCAYIEGGLSVYIGGCISIVILSELELELIQPHMAQKSVLRGEVGCVSVRRILNCFFL